LLENELCKLEIRLPSRYNLTFNLGSTKLGFEIIKNSKIKKKREGFGR